MRIAKITINNFKGYAGKHEFEVDAPVICFVGENNTGKSTIFKAINFLLSGVEKGKESQDYLNASLADDNFYVEVEISGQLKNVIEEFGTKKYESYIKSNDASETIILRRGSESYEIEQSSKKVKIDISKITFYSFESRQFENPAGVDKMVKGIFEVVTIWSDFKTDELMDFASTKPLGKLTNEISKSFMKSDDWNNFIEAHQCAFVTGENCLSKQTDELKEKIQNSLKDFYGEATIAFNFEPPEASQFIKLGMVHVDDGVNTSLTEKGSGMQRAYAFSVMRVYADYLAQTKGSEDLDKPLFFLIDEPEISLHPRAQQTLFQALKDISIKQQVFITTHSPFLLKNFGDADVITFANKKDDKNCIESMVVDEMKTFTFSPTLSEINYFAFGIFSNDFHCELYGYICLITNCKNPKDFDSWTINKNFLQHTKTWKRDTHNEKGKCFNVTLPTFIRNSIHHPENQYNQDFSQEELSQSTTSMLEIMQESDFKALFQVYEQEINS